VKIPIDSIIVDPSIQIRQRLHEEAVVRYVDAFDELPPIVVFETPEGRLLSDGMHRLAAANRLGMLDIEVDLRKGTRADAEEHAITANTKNAMPLSASERDEGIHRLTARGWGFFKIAKAMSLPQLTVERVVDGQKVKNDLSVTLRSKSHYEELSRFPEPIREPLAQAAIEQGWNSVQMRQAGKALQDSGADQFIDLGALQKAANAAAHDDPLAALYGALKALAWLKARWTSDITHDLESADRRRIDGDIEEYILLLRKVQAQLMETVQ
jgi:ParB-like chromosome segregation protein Spo0J